MTFRSGTLRQQVQQFLGHAVRHVLLILFRGHVHERKHGDRFSSGLQPPLPGTSRPVHGFAASSGARRLGRVLVAPEEAAAKQEQQGEDREFGAGDAPVSTVAVKPGEDEHDG